MAVTRMHSIRMFVAVAGISVLAWSTVPALAQAPFRGERLMYDVRWSATLARLTAGSGALEVSPSPNGGSVYSVVCEARLTPALASLYYRAETMAAARTLLPLQGTIHNQIGEQPAHEILRVGATGRRRLDTETKNWVRLSAAVACIVEA